MKWLLSELEALDPAAERFDAKATVLIENVRHHVKEEETELFPKVRQRIERRRLVELGAELRDAKRRAPTHPHPRSPDAPPANVLVGSAVAVMDKARDVGKRTVDRGQRRNPGALIWNSCDFHEAVPVGRGNPGMRDDMTAESFRDGSGAAIVAVRHAADRGRAPSS